MHATQKIATATPAGWEIAQATLAVNVPKTMQPPASW